MALGSEIKAGWNLRSGVQIRTRKENICCVSLGSSHIPTEDILLLDKAEGLEVFEKLL